LEAKGNWQDFVILKYVSGTQLFLETKCTTEKTHCEQFALSGMVEMGYWT
jgi:hypothetical protein